MNGKKDAVGRAAANRKGHPSRAKPISLSPSASRTVAVVHEAHFAGPVPPPDVLAAYDRIIPGAAQRILAMAEKQQLHRQELEKTVIRGDSGRATTGMVLAFIITLTVVIFGSLLIWQGKSVWGLALVLSDLAVLAGVFVYANNSRRQERSEKSRNLSREALAHRERISSTTEAPEGDGQP